MDRNESEIQKLPFVCITVNATPENAVTHGAIARCSNVRNISEYGNLIESNLNSEPEYFGAHFAIFMQQYKIIKLLAINIRSQSYYYSI